MSQGTSPSASWKQEPSHKGRREVQDPGKQLQNNQAYKSGMTFRGKEMHFNLVDALGLPIPADQLHVPHFREKCGTCSFRILCNGCFECGACDC